MGSPAVTAAGVGNTKRVLAPGGPGGRVTARTNRGISRRSCQSARNKLSAALLLDPYRLLDGGAFRSPAPQQLPGKAHPQVTYVHPPALAHILTSQSVTSRVATVTVLSGSLALWATSG